MSQRKSHTCLDCTRRKIKCDKVIPCSNCVKKGKANTCRRADDPPRVAERGDGNLASQAGAAHNTTEVSEAGNTLSVVNALADRVHQLEAALQSQASRKRPAPEDDSPPSARSKARPRDLTTLKNATLDCQRAESSPLSYPSSRALDESPNSSEAEVEDAATVLEFLAWGRLKDSAATNSARDANTNQSAIVESARLQSWDASPTSVTLNAQVETSQLVDLQNLIPDKVQVYHMIEFHEDWLLWMHASWTVITFNEELESFYSEDNGSIVPTVVKVQWAALLFAVLTTSLISAKKSSLAIWGYSEQDQSVLARRWYQATVDALHLARYHENHHIHGIQAISTVTIAAHLLGFSNTQSVLLAGAIRVSQALGLHRLRKEKDEQQQDIKAKLRLQGGRRLWQQLVIQDWFSVSFSETYSINPLHFTSLRPAHCDERTMDLISPEEPSLSCYSNFLCSIASLMPRLLDKMLESHTIHSKYEQVLKMDKKIRQLATYQLPPSLSSQTPLKPSWPCWVIICRRNLTVTTAHKVIMIHRTYLGLSFSDKSFEFTRKTCIAAAKTILKEFKQDQSEDVPLLWTMQAFSVAAAIILSLDNFNQPEATPEYREHRQTVQDTIDVLSRSVTISSIAARGTRLLTDLLDEELQARRSSQRTRNRPSHTNTQRASSSLDVSAFVQKFCEAEHVPPPISPVVSAHVPLWLQPVPENMYTNVDQPPVLDGTLQSAMKGATNFGNPVGFNNPFTASTRYAQEHFGNPFDFDIRTVNWLDDLLGIAPSQSL